MGKKYNMTLYSFKWFRLLFIIITTPVSSYPEFECPSRTEWKFRAVSKCTIPEGYHCLFNENTDAVVEFCDTRSYNDPAGHKLVLVGDLDRRDCEGTRYQPFSFSTNGMSACIFEKTYCKEEGQVIHTEGTADSDRQCRCDYTRSYAFIIKPEQSCYCVPSKEDCSCYKKTCPLGFIMTPDYECINKTVWTGTFTCALIHYNGMHQFVELEIKDGIQRGLSTRNQFELSDYCYSICNYDNEISFRKAFSKVFFRDGQGYTKCGCSSRDKTRCNTKSFLCKNEKDSKPTTSFIPKSKETERKAYNSSKEYKTVFVVAAILFALAFMMCVLYLDRFLSAVMMCVLYLDRFLSGSSNGYKNFDDIIRENLELKNRLDNPIPENIKELQNYEKKQWKERLDRFVETEASRIILESMKKDQCILVTGPHGCGKSSLAFHVALTLVENENCELLIVTNPDDIVKYASKDKKQIFIIDDIFGKYSVHEYDTMWWSDQGHLVPTLKDRNKDFKILATCRSYIYHSVDIVIVKSAFVHLNLLGEDLKMNEDNRRKIGKSYLNAEIINQLGSEVIMRFSFFPTLCGKYSPDTKENAVEYFSNPYSYVAEEIEKCNKTKDLHYFSLALIVISNNNVKKEKLIRDNNNQSQDGNFNELIHCLANEIGCTQTPSKQSIHFCLNALVGSYCIETEYGYSFMNETLLYIIACVLSQQILRSLLKYGKTSFLKDRVQFLSLNGHHPKMTIMIPPVLEKAYFDRILIDIKQGLFWDVITDTQNAFPQFREAFTSYMKTVLKWNHLKNSDDGSTVLHAVSFEGYDDYVTYFLDLDKSLVNKDNKSGQIPLHLACQNGHSITAQLLLTKGAFIDKTDKNENTPLDLACAGGHSDTVVVLLSRNATIKQRQQDLTTALHIVCRNGNKSIAKMLLDKNAKVNIRDKSGYTPLYLASQKGCTEIVALLLQHGADVNIADNKGRTALFLSCEKKQKGIADILLKHNARTLIDNEDGKHAIHRCCEVGSSEIIELLLSHGVDINQRDSHRSTPLHWACKKGHELIVKMLLNKNADVCLYNENRNTPLHIACKKNNVNIIKMLLDYLANVNCTNIYEKTPLHLVCAHGLQEAVFLLLQYGADVCAKDKESTTPLHLACFSGNEQIVEELCKHGVSLDETEKYGRTPLHICCEQGHSGLITILKQYGTDMNKKEEGGLTPLYIACRDEKVDIIKSLLIHGAHINETDKDGWTPLYLACKESNIEIARILIQEGANVNQADKDGMTPLHLTAHAGNADLTKVLIESKASVNMVEKLGQTPLFKSLSAVHKNVTELLLQNGASVNVTDKFGMDPTRLALQKRDSEVINLLKHYNA